MLAHAGVPSSTMCMGLSGAGFTCPWPSTVQRDSLCREVHSQVVAALTLEEPYLYGLAVTRGEACGTHAEALTHMHTHTQPPDTPTTPPPPPPSTPDLLLQGQRNTFWSCRRSYPSMLQRRGPRWRPRPQGHALPTNSPLSSLSSFEFNTTSTGTCSRSGWGKGWGPCRVHCRLVGWLAEVH